MSDNRFHINCIGLNHQTANVALRERLAFSPHHLETSLARLGCGDDPTWNDIRELVILSTCNRVELYAVGINPLFESLETFLSATQSIPISEFSPSIYRLAGEEAVRHLFRVAAGLDSVVLGEPQILGQVGEAYTAALWQGTAGKVLSRLFQRAIHAGKRVRSETAIGHSPASIASVAVRLISAIVPRLTRARIIVLGAGEMAELAVEALRKRGAGHVLVVNRTLERARELAQRWNGQAAALEMLLDLLPDADIVITSTGAPHIIINASMVERVMRQRPHRPLVFMDIAVPRDVDARVGEIPGVELYDMDTLSERLEVSLAQREAEVPIVEAILSEECAGFMEFLASLDVLPLIVKMRKQANAIRQSELDKTMRRMPDLPPEAQRQIDAMTRSIVKKILHSPTVCLRDESNGPDSAEYASLTRRLFGLD